MNRIDHVRELIRSEVARANPVEESRRALELIVETSLRFSETETDGTVTVVDDEGRRRTKIVDGQEADLTIADVVAELRRKHPSLFKPAQAAAAPAEGAASPGPADAAGDAPSDESPPAGAASRIAEPPAPPRAAPEPSRPPRDVLLLEPRGDEQPTRLDASAEPGEAAPEAEPEAPPERSADPQAGQERIRSRAKSLRPVRLHFNKAAAARVLAPAHMPSGGLLSSLRGSSGPFGTFRESRPRPSRVLTVANILLLVPLVGYLGWSILSAPPPREAASASTARTEPRATGSIDRPTAAEGTPAERTDQAALRGVAEVLDTATLSVQGKVVRLFGVEWARGAGDPDDLAGYLRGREVVCRPHGTVDRHRCEVQGQDLSRVVLYNGGGRATPDATPDLKAAEDHARQQQLGVWGAESLKARP